MGPAMISHDGPRRWSFRVLTQRMEMPFRSQKADRPLSLAFKEARDRLMERGLLLLEDV